MSTVVPLLSNSDTLESYLKELPSEPGIYLMRNGEGDILYIGKSKKLRSRVRSYFQKSQFHMPRIALMLQQVTDIDFIVTDTEAEALALEATLIKQYQPYFNVLLKDDKKYPYVCITWSEEYPRIFITRKRRLNKERDRYYGPYVDTHLLRYTLRLVKQVFPLRQRPKPLFKDRPCLNYELGKCPGVCQGLISTENYNKIVAKIAMIFQGRTAELIAILKYQMEKEVVELNFEKAAAIRDQLKAINTLTVDQKVSLPDDTISRDAIALASDTKHCCIQLFQIRAGRLVGRLGFFTDVDSGIPGAILKRVLEEHYWQADGVEIPNEIIVQHKLPEMEILEKWLSERKGKKVSITVPQRQLKAQLIDMVERNANYELERTQRTVEKNLTAMEDLTQMLGLPELPRRIEGYDISHIQGSNAVASQVVFIDGIPAKQHYRHFKIKSPTVKIGHSDDFTSMAEVISRRFHHYQSDSDDRPNVIMIDGGKGQLSAVVAVLKKLNLMEEFQVVSLAKQKEEIFLPMESKPLTTNSEQPGVLLLRRVRDEAHRFAVSFHRQQRLKKSRRSRLDEIPGLGFERQKYLLAYFHSIDYIREASVEELQQVPGFGKALAKEIYNYFHPH
ncbi:excinuclease ABC subunit C [cyanobacterium endosymbiont of Epithemia turgida isolate EtSB Lake Yunoko]|nr:excinuclease ABC subunit UvrC [cyanobacterium endosymbiont of Epithemia turgida]BAP17937.1 excinuclease ABC subunit C [cyanobacterium endosymbiont of Epithemia turgida isolate EtSB Lake Yunoko]